MASQNAHTDNTEPITKRIAPHVLTYEASVRSFLAGGEAGVDGYAPLVSPESLASGQQRAAAYAARYCAFIIT